MISFQATGWVWQNLVCKQNSSKNFVSNNCQKFEATPESVATDKLLKGSPINSKQYNNDLKAILIRHNKGKSRLTQDLVILFWHLSIVCREYERIQWWLFEVVCVYQLNMDDFLFHWHRVALSLQQQTIWLAETASAAVCYKNHDLFCAGIYLGISQWQVFLIGWC